MNKTSVLCLRCAHCLRSLFATSVLSAYTVRSHYAVFELPARLDVCTIKCHPYYVRDIRTLTVLHPRYPLQSAGNLGKFVHLQLHPYLIRTRSTNFDQIPYYLRTVYAKFRPYSIRFDPQRPCVGVKGALECCNMTLLLVTEFTLNYCCNDH